jgi:hypothetical protein
MNTEFFGKLFVEVDFVLQLAAQTCVHALHLNAKSVQKQSELLDPVEFLLRLEILAF